MKNWQIYVNKSHNYYLETSFSYGIPALFALLIMFLLHLYNSFVRLFVKERSKQDSYSLALLGFVCAYLLQWLFNDSTIGSSIIFWILLGIAVFFNIDKPTSLQKNIKKR